MVTMVKWICRSFICLYLCLTVTYAKDAHINARKPDSNPKPEVAMFRLDTMCGANCLWQIAKVYGKDCTPRDIAEFAGTSTIRGTKVEGMVQACKHYRAPCQSRKNDD
jgi:hypothetical protein